MLRKIFSFVTTLVVLSAILSPSYADTNVPESTQPSSMVLFSNPPDPCGGGTLGYWPMDEGVNNVLHDLCNGFDGSFAQGIDWFADPTHGPYLKFSGDDGPRIAINGATESPLTSITVEVSIMVGPTSGEPMSVIANTGPVDSGQFRFNLDYSGSHLQVKGAAGGGDFWFCGVGNVDCLRGYENQWVHVAFQIDATTVKMFYDGRLVATDTLGFVQRLHPTIDSIAIGTNDGTDNFDGSIQYVRISSGMRDDLLLERVPTDVVSPPWAVPADMVVEAEDFAGAVVSYDVLAADDVKVIRSTCVPASGSVFPIGTTVVSCSALDEAGNEGRASFKVTVQDTTAPTWIVPVNITVEAATSDGAVVNYWANASDEVGIASSNCVPAPGKMFPLGTTTVECTASDRAGNLETASFTVTVQDTTASDWVVPSDITVNTDPGESTAVVNYWAIVSDGVGLTSSNCTPVSGSKFPVGTTLVNCIASDEAGNQGNASFTVTVQDNESPTWEIPDDIMANTDSGGSTARVNYVAVASDNVGVTRSSCAPASGSMFPVGTTVVNCVASDATGNQGNASFTVTIHDVEPPAWDVPSDIMTSTDPGQPTATIEFIAIPSDNVAVDTSNCMPASGSAFPLGTTLVDCEAVDTAGNRGTASFTVTVRDTEEPSWNPPVVDLADLSPKTLTGTDVNYIFKPFDNVAVTAWSCMPRTGSEFPLGSTVVTCMASDAAGNVSRVSYTVTVEVSVESISILRASIESMGLLPDVQTVLVQLLDEANAFFVTPQTDDNASGCVKLNEFLDAVQDNMARGYIPSEQARRLSTFTEAIKERAWCP